MTESYNVMTAVLDVVGGNRLMRNLEPFGEPQLGTRGLYDALGGTDIADVKLAMLWVLNQSDGTKDLLETAIRSGIPFVSVVAVAQLLEDHGLLEEIRRRADD